MFRRPEERENFLSRREEPSGRRPASWSGESPRRLSCGLSAAPLAGRANGSQGLAAPTACDIVLLSRSGERLRDFAEGVRDAMA